MLTLPGARRDMPTRNMQPIITKFSKIIIFSKYLACRVYRGTIVPLTVNGHAINFFTGEIEYSDFLDAPRSFLAPRY